MALARFIVTWLLYMHAPSSREVAADSARLEGSRLVVLAAGKTIEGDGLLGAEIGAVGGGRYRIDRYVAPAAGSDAHQYVISSLEEGTWVSFCKDGAPAIPLYGRWDDHGAKHASKDVTFACVNGALGKCVLFGYRPWVSPEHADLHQACTRLVRADYCGDGRSYTRDGTLIGISDSAGINVDRGEEPWLMEAEWTPQGARCLARGRRPEIELPVCAKRRLEKTCGAQGSDGKLRSGVRLWNTVPPTGSGPRL